MDKAVNLDEERRWRETAPELRSKDGAGTWFCYLVQFECDGRLWGAELWAHDHADAARRLEAMKASGTVLGQRVSSEPG